jgi:hypothetical protein
MAPNQPCDQCGEPIGGSAYCLTPQIPELRKLYFTTQAEVYCGAECSLLRTEWLKTQANESEGTT